MMLTKQDLKDITSIVQDAIQTSVPPIVERAINKLIETQIKPFRKEMDDFAIAVANQFGRVEKRLDTLEYRMENIENRMENMEGKMDEVLLIQNVHETRITTLEDSSRRVHTVLKLG